MLKIYNSHVQIEAVPNWSPYLTSTPADTVKLPRESVDPVICHESVEFLRKTRLHNQYTLRSTYLAYTRECNSASNAEILQNVQQHAIIHLLRSWPEDMTSVNNSVSSKQTTRPSRHEYIRQHPEISESKNPLYCWNKISRRENNIRRILFKPFRFGFSEILQAGVSISLPKPSALWQPEISWLQHLRQIQYSYPVNSHDSSNQLLISDWRIF